MKYRIIAILTFLLLTFFNLTYATPINLSHAKQAVISYYESGEFEKEVELAIKDAEKYLIKRIEQNSHSLQPQKLAIVLDIDDTSLSNFPDYKKIDFARSWDAIIASYHEANAPAIKPILRLYNEAIKNNVSVFFISLRPEQVRSDTINNLHKASYAGWSGLYLPSEDEKKSLPESYKTMVRKMLYAQGYQIILNIGDQDGDLSGGYAEHVTKIPNPLYATL